MLTFLDTTKILLAVAPIDGRLGYDGLIGLAQQRLGENPLDGRLFLFTNRRRNRLKVLWWDGSGYWLCSKRLERGTFGWPASGEVAVGLLPEEFMRLAQGMELRLRRGWYRHTAEKKMSV